MSLSTLRAPISGDSLTLLTDDSLLVILGYLSVPQLLTFLSLSRRLNSLIVQYILPRYRTIHLPNFAAHSIAIAKCELLKNSLFFSRRYYSHNTLYLPQAFYFDFKWSQELSHFLSVPLFKSQLSSFPLDLPRLLWRLQSLTFSYFLEKCLLNEEEKRVNRCLTVYLHSSWSQTLVSLNLYFDIGQGPQADENLCLFAQLNNLPLLRHLFLHFVHHEYPDEAPDSLPDSFPVLSQLHSFSLHWYEGSNTITLLYQLGPNLALLSLSNGEYLFQDVLLFLSSKPSYRSTLTTLQFNELPVHSFQWSTLTSSFPALVNLYGPFSFEGASLFTFFTLLGRLSKLREMLDFHLSIENLRTLRGASYPLPTLPSIRRLSLYIECSRLEKFDLQANELFDEHLPLLGAIFCAAENVQVFFKLPWSTIESFLLSKQLADKVKEHFPSVRSCEAHCR